MYPLIAIVGRPNVGKSSLFNCILRKRLAIVHEQSGVTRDRLEAVGEYDGRKFRLVDTGGLGLAFREKTKDLFDNGIRDQVELAVQDAAVLLWVVNVQEGITPLDEEVATFVRRTGKPVILVANKCDNPNLVKEADWKFAKLGVKEIIPMTCAHGTGVYDVLESALAKIPEEAWEQTPEAEVERLKVAVVGRPNVGKSSLVNRMLGRERMIVSDIPGTTRDAVDEPVDLVVEGEELPITIIDTAGMRRRKQLDSVVEFFSVSRSENAIKRCDLVLFLLDATDLCAMQERRIGHVIMECHKPCLLIVNKWDLAKKEGLEMEEAEERVRREMPFMAHAPILFCSMLNGYHFKEIAKYLMHIREQMRVTVGTGELNAFLKDLLERQPPPSSGTKRFKIFYGTMDKSKMPPKFILFVNKKSLCPANYLAYIANSLRDAFYPEAGLPVLLELRERESHDGDEAGGKRRAAAGEKLRKEADYQAKRRRQSRARGYHKK